MNTKTLIGGLMGGVVYFLLGMLVYQFLMKDMMASNMNCMRPEAEMSLPLGIVANLLWGLFLAFVLSKWQNVNSFGSGLQAGALFTAALAVAVDVGFYAYSTLFNSWSGVAIDVVVNVVMGAIVGGVIGWWFGRK